MAEEEREVTARAFSAYGSPLEMVTSFKYLGRVISATDDYHRWELPVGNYHGNSGNYHYPFFG